MSLSFSECVHWGVFAEDEVVGSMCFGDLPEPLLKRHSVRVFQQTRDVDEFHGIVHCHILELEIGMYYFQLLK